jgi:hypothetical protein
MKLFDGFEAVKFSEENLILITQDGYLYYIYDPEENYWQKHHNAGNDCITVSNYADVSKAELVNAMQGVYPEKETDFMRLCLPAQLCIRDMLDLLWDDFVPYMSDDSIYYTIHSVLSEAAVCHKAFTALKKILDDAAAQRKDNQQVLMELKELSFAMLGRDIFKKEIRVVDGHNRSSYFWIMPIRVVDDSDTNELDNVAEMKSLGISIEENDVADFLAPFLRKHFDDELEANQKRKYSSGFEWYLTYNYFTFESVQEILRDIGDTIDALSFERENEFTAELNIKRCPDTELAEYEYGVGHAIDFYQRFIYRMEYMMRVGKENGYDLISFLSP